MNLFLTKEQVQEFTHQQCSSHLKLLMENYNIHRPLHEWQDEIWPVLDPVVDTLLYLEDRMGYLEHYDSSMFATPVYKTITRVIEGKKVKVLPPKRRFKALDKVYDNIDEAAKKTGVTVKTLRAYISTKPDRYGYVDLELDNENSGTD
jgi:hypothetical protein